VEYVVNERGERTAVILTLEEYERLIEAAEDAEDLIAAREVMARLERGEETRTLRRARGAPRET